MSLGFWLWVVVIYMIANVLFTIWLIGKPRPTLTGPVVAIAVVIQALIAWPVVAAAVTLS